MSEPELTAVVGRATASPGAREDTGPSPSGAGSPGGPGPGSGAGGLAQVLRTAAGRNLGLVVALVVLCIVGGVTGGDRFADRKSVV